MGGEHMGDASSGEAGFQRPAAEPAFQRSAAEPAFQSSPHQSFTPSSAEPAFQRTPPEPVYQQRPEPPPAKDPAPRVEAERAPIQHNVPPVQEVSGPAANPKKGWWRR